MKKYLIIALVALFCVQTTSVQAQIVTSKSSQKFKIKKPKKNTVWLEVGVGAGFASNLYMVNNGWYSESQIVDDGYGYYREWYYSNYGYKYFNETKSPGIGFNLGFRLTHMFSEHWGWDIINFRGTNNSGGISEKDFSFLLGVQGTTGVRYVSKPVIGDKTLYANLGVGGGIIWDSMSGGEVVWELGAGINLSKSISLGLFYDGQYIVSTDNDKKLERIMTDKTDMYGNKLGYWERGDFNPMIGTVGVRLSVGLFSF